MSEIKYIIVRDRATKHLRHFKSTWLHHETIARDNGFEPCEIIEAGLFLDKQLYILESEGEQHKIKHQKHYIGNRLNYYSDLRLRNWLKGRELKSQVYYNKKAVGLRDGD